MLHLDECTACQRYVSDLSETADALVLLAPEAEPPPGFERRALDRIMETSRRRRWRTTKLVAVTAAAAAILSVVTVRIVDDSRTPTSQVAAPATQSVAMVGDGGQPVGRVDVSTDASTTTLDVSVAYGLPDGYYNVVLTSVGVGRQTLATMHVVDKHGEWKGSVPATTGPARLSLADFHTDKDLCSAELRAT